MSVGVTIPNGVKIDDGMWFTMFLICSEVKEFSVINTSTWGETRAHVNCLESVTVKSDCKAKNFYPGRQVTIATLFNVSSVQTMERKLMVETSYIFSFSDKDFVWYCQCICARIAPSYQFRSKLNVSFMSRTLVRLNGPHTSRAGFSLVDWWDIGLCLWVFAGVMHEQIIM